MNFECRNRLGYDASQVVEHGRGLLDCGHSTIVEPVVQVFVGSIGGRRCETECGQ